MPSNCLQAIKLLWRSLGDSGCTAFVIVSLSKSGVLVLLSKYSVTMPNLILSEYLVDNGCIHPLLVNSFYRQTCQNALLITGMYIYINCWSTSPINKSITY